MKILLFSFLTLLGSPAFGAPADLGIPEEEAKLIRTTDYVEVSGTNDLGGTENFTIHNSKAIAQFVQFLTDERYTAVPKDLKPQFKSLSSYKVRLSAKGVCVLELQVIADSILDLPKESSYYMQSEKYSDNLMAPLLRLR